MTGQEDRKNKLGLHGQPERFMHESLASWPKKDSGVTTKKAGKWSERQTGKQKGDTRDGAGRSQTQIRLIWTAKKIHA